jgi:hypothetical protein
MRASSPSQRLPGIADTSVAARSNAIARLHGRFAVDAGARMASDWRPVGSPGSSKHSREEALIRMRVELGGGELMRTQTDRFPMFAGFPGGSLERIVQGPRRGRIRDETGGAFLLANHQPNR